LILVANEDATNSLKPAARASGDYAPHLTVLGFRLQASNAVGQLNVGGSDLDRQTW